MKNNKMFRIRAAKLYKFDPEIYNKLTEKGFNFEF